MTAPQTAPYGSWASPISAEQIAAGTVGLGQIELTESAAYWLELRPAEGGRQVVVRRDADGVRDVIGPPFSARTRVHEYGGGAYLVHGEEVIFANFTDQRLYRVRPSGEPALLAPEGSMRYADGEVDARRGRLICIREDHTGGGEPVNAVVAIDLAGGQATVLVRGNDFYASPRLSPDGRQLAWLTWNRPDMPWDHTELWVAPVLDTGRLGPARRVAGADGESVVQPVWSPGGELLFISDRSGWWNLYRPTTGKPKPVVQVEAEFAGPMWRLRPASYAFTGPGQIVCTYSRRGISRLARIDLDREALEDIDTPFNAIGSVRVAGGAAWFIAGSPTISAAVVRLDLKTGRAEIVRKADSVEIDPEYISPAEPVEFPTADDRTAHALFYRPRNPRFRGPAGAKPPLRVVSHGGPTAATTASLRLKIQYYTSRGFAVADVNYGGSTGYGRDYRRRLNGKWGVVDVDDCTHAAVHLARAGEVDGDRLVITGGSAGGYTTLAALTFRDVFAAGASHFGVSDCEALARETHKFESRYLDRLIGPYPRRRDLYVERSPIHHTDRLSCPIIFFQGLDDRIVPPNQAERMVAALREKHLPVAYVAFEGEQHGFRQAANIRRALEAELYFFSKVLGFDLHDAVEPVPIENL